MDPLERLRDDVERFHLPEEAAEAFLAAVPPFVRQAFERRAAELEFPVWAVLEMYLAQAMDPDSLSFLDCPARPEF